MGDPAEELRKLRDELDALRALADSAEGSDLAGGVALVCEVVAGPSYPATGAVGKVFLLQAYDVGGVDTEGATGTLASRPGNFPAANLLAGRPAAGTVLVAHGTPGGWVFSYA